MKKLLIIQKNFMPYRTSVYDELALHYDVCLLFSDTGEPGASDTGIRMKIPVHESTFFNESIAYQHGIIKNVRRVDPDMIFVMANPRYISFWMLLAYCKFTGRKVFSHSQGPYNKPRSLVYKLLYSLMAAMSYRVILYTPYSLKKIEELGMSSSKFRVVPNSLVNDRPATPQEKDFSVKGILFIGRLRQGVHLELLLDEVTRLNAKDPAVQCHVVGSGEQAQYYIKKYSGNRAIIFHGEVYGQKEISDISRMCAVGCYPGDAGLSVVHYMSLSLPCLVHGDLSKHMGPEPSYVEEGYNGRLFSCCNAGDFSRVLEEMLYDEAALGHMAGNAYKTYTELTRPSYARRMIEVMEE